MGWVARSRKEDVQMGSLAERTWEEAEVQLEAPLKEQPLPQHGCRHLTDSRVSQPWTFTEHPI